MGHFDNGFKGGVHVGVKTPEEIKDYASKMLGAKLITKQTGAGGRICNTVGRLTYTHVHMYMGTLCDTRRW